MNKKKGKDLFEEAISCGIQAGMNWYVKLRKRCLIEGCRYGVFPSDKPKDECIYCGEPNFSTYSGGLLNKVNKLNEK